MRPACESTFYQAGVPVYKLYLTSAWENYMQETSKKGN